MMPIRKLLYVFAGLATLACASESRAQTPDQIAIRVDWSPWGVQAPFYLAQAKGWFKAAGLNVAIEDGNGTVTTIQIVGSSSQFDVGHASLAAMMIAHEKGLPVKVIAHFMRDSDIGLLVPKDSGITHPKQLKGLKIVYTAGSLEAPFIDPFLAAGGLKRSDVELINVDAAAKTATYLAGRADAALSSIPFFLPIVAQNRPSEGVRFADFGLSLPSYGLFATEAKLKEKGDALKRFASIVSGTWQYIFDGHVDEAVDAMVNLRPQVKLDKTVLRGQIETMRPYFKSRVQPDVPIGVILPTEWEMATKTLGEAGAIPAGAQSAQFIQTGLVDPAIFRKASGQ